MSSLAIIGTGIAGLGSAHFLHRHFDLTLFEQNACTGGHTHTVSVPETGTGRPAGRNGASGLTAKPPGGFAFSLHIPAILDDIPLRASANTRTKAVGV